MLKRWRNRNIPILSHVFHESCKFKKKISTNDTNDETIAWPSRHLPIFLKWWTVNLKKLINWLKILIFLIPVFILLNGIKILYFKQLIVNLSDIIFWNIQSLWTPVCKYVEIRRSAFHFVQLSVNNTMKMNLMKCM